MRQVLVELVMHDLEGDSLSRSMVATFHVSEHSLILHQGVVQKYKQMWSGQNWIHDLEVGRPPPVVCLAT